MLGACAYRQHIVRKRANLETEGPAMISTLVMSLCIISPSGETSCDKQRVPFDPQTQACEAVARTIKQLVLLDFAKAGKEAKLKFEYSCPQEEES
jgi:hypothetical protein